LHLAGILFPHINDDAGQNHIRHTCSFFWLDISTNALHFPPGQQKAPCHALSFSITWHSNQSMLE